MFLSTLTGVRDYLNNHYANKLTAELIGGEVLVSVDERLMATVLLDRAGYKLIVPLPKHTGRYTDIESLTVALSMSRSRFVGLMAVLER